MQNRVIILTGPTASGKSKLAIDYACKYGNIDIINADSIQVYRDIPIVSAQPNKKDCELTPHKLYGFLQGNVQLSAGKWIEMIKTAINDSHAKGRTPLLVGGSAMYIRLLMDGIADIPDISPEIEQKARELLERIGNEEFFQNLVAIDPNVQSKLKSSDTQRLLRAYCVKLQTGSSIYQLHQSQTISSCLEGYDVEKIVLMPLRQTIYASCNSRFLGQVQNGVIEEIEKLMLYNYAQHLSVNKAIGVPEIQQYIKGMISKEVMIEKVQQHTRNYAKRQSTWFNNKFRDFEVITEPCLVQMSSAVEFIGN